ncbi:16S rRNA (cytosine(1402)-N(4))-methyltransferase RsmH [Buchnera aphidicola (Thelaxes californica)]|uniref:Ribosomal RNA small subunit methyltransferase H n=1 Tax=Buchnera aphidicola (Thelaxes californica) TaxID=1315998 RepID=A0A4D6Y9N3_9GAMM|nr:16S rRNA (cytosine(1402)-N(4))-methyltransferase RsmH [Buchnera aphidicola]QCI26716.1 16S rRNA (cytosine(1402)-N(4))-methyltransferase RsmH [Buchnera aphidicola (Thelaxes californica)]
MTTIKTLHIPVLLNESIQALQIKEDGTYIDATFGYGGHTKQILKKLGKTGMLYAFDRDPYSIDYSKKIKETRLKVYQKKFSKIYEFATQKKIIGKIDGIIIDLGISNMQIKNASRGFSFTNNGILDMRMNPQEGIPAYKWLLTTKEKKIAEIIKKFGEEKYSKKIAYQIVQQNKIKPIKYTHELVKIIKKIIPIKIGNKHPATRTFQAIRIYINQEITELKSILATSLKILKKNGKLTIISFHSLEDRIIKKFMIKFGKTKQFPKNMPINETQIKFLSKPILSIKKKIKPSFKEILNNPSSRSAILRIAKKII